MSQYQTLDAQQAVAYAQTHGGLANPKHLVRAEEIGDGNLNLVFKIYDTDHVSRIIVKQSLPYVRCVGTSWPLTLDRARLEAQTLQLHYQYCPEHTVRVVHFDPEQYIIVMEDLSDHQIWRAGLLEAEYYPQAAQQLGTYLATCLFYTSDFYQHPHDKKELVAQFINQQMCAITEELFFSDPYMDHERNQYPSAIADTVQALRQDDELAIAVAQLKYRFLTSAQALLHGDIHSGSIFVKAESLKVIDAEFGFFGPMGFDIGTAIGNLLLNYCGGDGLFSPALANDMKALRLKEIEQLWQTFSEQFSSLVFHYGVDKTLANTAYVDSFLLAVWQDSLGYAGAELIRRNVGLAHVADIDNISDATLRHDAVRRAIILGRELMVDRHRIADPRQLISCVLKYA